MSHDNLRSVGYRSFVTCDDPRGVVNCSAIRKSKTSKKKGKDLEESKMLKKLSKFTSHYEGNKELVFEEGIKDSDRASSFQLLEVSRGAQKLNQVIDSWSKRKSFDGQSKDIAKDLLMGALDLQDSLVMLSELQEASQYMAKLKKKQKEKACVCKADEVGIERTSSDRFGNPNYQNPRLSADGSARDCYDELREVIRDSLARQNLLPQQSARETAHFDRKKMNPYADMPSTSSSSMSSLSYSRDFASSESTSSSKILESKPRTSNLVAKLMGLEDMSSKPLLSASQKQLQRESCLIQNPIFDIDVQKKRKPQFIGRKKDNGYTLEEIIENMHLKGLLENNQHQTYNRNTFYTERRHSYDAPPIVLMKPTHPGVEAEKHFSHKFILNEAASNYEKKQRISKTKEEIASKVLEYPRGSSKSNDLSKKLPYGEPPSKKLSTEKEAKKIRKVLAKAQDIEVIKEKKLSSNKMKDSVPVSSISEKEIVEKKIDKIRKPTSKNKLVEVDSVKSKCVPRKQDKVPTTKLKKPEIRENNMNKSCISQQKSTALNSTVKHTKSASSFGGSDQKRSVKNIKPVREPLTTNKKILVPSIVCNDHDKLTDLEEKYNTTIMNSAPAFQLVTEKQMDVSGILVKENYDIGFDALCENFMLPAPLEDSTKCPDEATDQSQHEPKEINIYETKTSADTALSRTPESLQEKEVPSVSCDEYQPLVLQAFTGLQDSGIVNSKLLLDCANELLESRSQTHKLLANTLLHVPVDDSSFFTSKDNLIEDAMENITSYSGSGVGSVPAADIVFSVLERDLRCKALAAGGWDLGWRKGFTRDEVEQIVSDLDKLIMNELIDEVLADSVV